MPNYSLVIDAKFRPYSYQELALPLMQMTQAHQQLEDQYAEMSTKANEWSSRANEQTDPKAYAMYKRYADDLKAQADQLAAVGLNPQSRQNMYNMRSRYSSEILPIETAYNSRDEQRKMQQKILAQDPTHMFGKNASTISLDEFLTNPTLDTISQNYSGALLTQQVSQAANNLARELTSTGVGRLDEYTKTFLQQHGLTREDVLRAVNNPDNPKSSKVLNAIVEGVMNSSGIKNWADESTLRRAYNYARQGLWPAIGGTQISTFEDKGAIMAAQLRMAAQAAQNQAPINTLPIDTDEIESPNTDGSAESLKIRGNELNKRYNKNGIAVLPSTTYLRDNKGNLIPDHPGMTVDAHYRYLNRDGSVMTRRQFLAENAPKNDPRLKGLKTAPYIERLNNANKAYDMLVNDFDKAGISYNKLKRMPNYRDLNSTISKLTSNNGGIAIKGTRLMLDDDEKALTHVMSRLQNPDETYNMFEVTSIGKDGTVHYNKTKPKLSDIPSVKADDNGLKAIPTMYVSGNPKAKGLFVMHGGKTYFVPSNYLGSIFNNSFNNLNRIKQAQQLRDKYIKKYGESAYNNSTEKATIEDIIKNSGSAWLTDIHTSIEGKVDKPSFKAVDNK